MVLYNLSTNKILSNFVFVKENERILTVAIEKDVFYHKQPFLIVVCSIEQPITFFLVVDQTAIPVSSDSCRAFNCLFSSFFVFGVEYPQYLEKFFNFFEQYVFGIFPSKGKINSSNQEFVNTLDDIAGKLLQSTVNK